MSANIKSAAATQPVPEIIVPEVRPEKQLLEEVAEAVVADCQVGPDKYIEEVRVAVGGE
jgi:hypothetical protein